MAIPIFLYATWITCGIIIFIMFFRSWLGYMRDEYYQCGCGESCNKYNCSSGSKRLYTEPYNSSTGDVFEDWVEGFISLSVHDMAYNFKSRNIWACVLNSILISVIFGIISAIGYAVIVNEAHVPVGIFLLVALVILIPSYLVRKKYAKIHDVERKLTS